MTIDHRTLLRKYIGIVVQAEGTDFIDGWPDHGVSPEEHAELMALSQESSDEREAAEAARIAVHRR